VLLGIGGLIAGVSTGLVVIGVIAFVVMLGGVMLAVTPTRGAARTPVDDRRPHSSTPPSSTSFMDRMNDRWDRRQDGR